MMRLLVIGAVLILHTLASYQICQLEHININNLTDCGRHCRVWSSTISEKGSLYVWTSNQDLLYHISAFKPKKSTGAIIVNGKPSVNVLSTSTSHNHSFSPYVVEMLRMPSEKKESYYLAGTVSNGLYMVGSNEDKNTSKLVSFNAKASLKEQFMENKAIQPGFYARAMVACSDKELYFVGVNSHLSMTVLKYSTSKHKVTRSINIGQYLSSKLTKVRSMIIMENRFLVISASVDVKPTIRQSSQGVVQGDVQSLGYSRIIKIDLLDEDIRSFDLPASGLLFVNKMAFDPLDSNIMYCTMSPLEENDVGQLAVYKIDMENRVMCNNVTLMGSDHKHLNLIMGTETSDTLYIATSSYIYKIQRSTMTILEEISLVDLSAEHLLQNPNNHLELALVGKSMATNSLKMILIKDTDYNLLDMDRTIGIVVVSVFGAVLMSSVAIVVVGMVVVSVKRRRERSMYVTLA
ncbi:hypothetical protein AKO1_005474 [Acrasis kona]|uniref:Uncharacterized protein n=1 Tax=Acrasis kona TaxID=1008807 RepID=A0AAW2YJS5_9EUKA